MSNAGLTLAKLENLEALVNAVYHRSYEEREPIEVRISRDELVVLSFPGPDRSIRLADFEAGSAVNALAQQPSMDVTDQVTEEVAKLLMVAARREQARRHAAALVGLASRPRRGASK